MKNQRLTNFGKILIATATLIVQLGMQAHLAFALSCDDVQKNNAEAKKYFISIQEENIGNYKSDSSQNPNKDQVIDCIRETSQCKSASPDAQQTTCSEIKNLGGSCSTGATCQRIQIVFGTSGEDLLYTWVGTIYRWAATTIGIVAVLFMVIGGIEIASAGGDSGKIEKAKERILQSLAGLVILFLSALILYTVNPNFFTAG